MPTSLPGLAADLLATQAGLRGVLLALAAEEWDRPTPAPGWTVRHQVRHLAHGEELGCLAAADPVAFAAERSRLLQDLGAVDAATTAAIDESPADLVERWWAVAADLRSAVAAQPAAERIGWVSGPMSRASFLSARVMETFAHGHDIGVAVGRPVPDGRALAHVAHLGLRTRDFSYANRGLPVPATRLRLELIGPEGDGWALGPEDADDRVAGPARDLCLVVTRRAHPDDTALLAEGPHAAEWLGIAQCFAGPPADGPPADRR